MQATDFSRRSPVGRAGRIIWASGLLIPLVFVLVMLCFAPISNPREKDADEGIELMKASLVSKGYKLYTEVWNDEPPVFTLVLAPWLRWFGSSVIAARALVLLFSALLLWAFYQTVRLAVSEAAALISVALLVLSSWYVQLSISVMIGLSAIALAMLSLYLLVLGQRRGQWWHMVASGIVFGLSVQTKLFTAILVPVIIIYLCFLHEAGSRQASAFAWRLGKCALWLGVVGVAFVVTGILVGTLDPRLLITPDFGEAARSAPFYQRFDSLALVAGELSKHVGYLFLAGLGIFWGFKRRIPTFGLALGWLAIALAALVSQKPVWYHHFLLMTVPLAWLSAFGVEAGLRAFGLRDRTRDIDTAAWTRRLARPSGMLVVGGLVVFALVSRGYALPDQLVYKSRNDRVVDRLRQAACLKPAWVYSDRPIYAFEAGLVVPPPAAVISKKRLVSGGFTEDMLLGVLHSYRPEYVVLDRFFSDLSQKFKESLSQDYAVLEEYRNLDKKVVAQLLVARPVDAPQVAGTGQAPARAVFDDWLTLDWTPALLGEQVKAGTCLEVPGLVWQRSAAHPGRDLGLSLRLMDRDGNVLAQHDEPLGTDFNTMRDRVQMPYLMNLLIPEGTPPGKYELALIVYDPETGQPLKVTGVAAAMGDRAVLDQVRVDRPAEALALRPALADFGPVRLTTADTPVTAVSPGDEIPLTMLWQAGPDHHGESFVVVAQLLDDQGKVAASLEEEPLNGRYGTDGWQVGELVRDHHTLSVPGDTPPGQYNLIIGLYRLPTRERLKTPAGLFGWRPRDSFVLRRIQVR